MRFLSILLILMTLLGCETAGQPVEHQPAATVLALSSITPDSSTPTAEAIASQTPSPAETEHSPNSSPPPESITTSPPVITEQVPDYPGPPTRPVTSKAYPVPTAETLDPPATAVVTEEPVHNAQASVAAEPIWGYEIVNEFPHDSQAYTQGLVIEDNLTTLLEGTGRESSLRRVDLASGEVLQMLELPSFFGEGITLQDGNIIQLTWQSQTGFVYDVDTFELLSEFTYPHQGWGLASDGQHLIVSDGSQIIRFWDSQTFEEVRRIEVNSLNGPVTQLNELEYVNGEIWANVWHTDAIVRIAPEDGRVLGWIDLSGLMNPTQLNDAQAVLNGIAYHEASGRLFVTGKLWPSLFEIRITKPNGS